MSDNKNKGFKLLGHFYISLLVGIFLVFFLSFTGFLLKAPIQKFYLPLSAALSLFLFCFFTKKDGFKGATLLKALIIYISFVLAAGAVSYFLCDMSWDGRWYHQAGVFLMKLGYNPVFDNDIVKFAKSVYNDTILSACLWVKHYPKFSEIFGANVCLLTGKIETAKIINYLVMYLCAAYSFLTFNNLFKSNSLRLNAFLTALITLTPITICQNATLYVDGLLYYFFIISLFSIVNIELAGNDNRAEQIFHITSLVLSLIMFANVKIACLFYAAFLLFAWFIYLILNKNKNSVFKKLIPVFVIFTLFAALSGANPYFTNIKTGKPVFYPIIGKDKINIFAPPPVLRGKNGFEKLMFSTFASSGNGEKSKYKIPLTISKNEAVFKHADLRISGFGYFWSGIALLTLFLLFKVRINDKNKRKMYALILATLILLFVLNPENWWASMFLGFGLRLLLCALFPCIVKAEKTRNLLL